MSACLNDAVLDRLHADELSPPELLSVREHLASCPECSRRNSELLAEHAKLLARLHGLTADATPPAARANLGDASTELWPTRTREDTPPTVAAVFQDDSSSRGGFSRKDLFPGYDIVRDLGQGGQGAVYLAIQSATKSKVAIKVLRDGVHATESAQKRFEREIQLAAQLRQHPNIITVYDSGTTADGRKFYVMDYVRGQPLTKFARENRVPLDEALRIFCTVCDAVHFAHQRGIVHRDLKPSNILVDTDRKPRILDFGLAKALAGPSDADLSVEQGFLGTLPYLAPEQARGSLGSVDYRTDVYSLGVVLYELLTGHFPYKVTDAMASVLRRIAEEPPASPRKSWEVQSGVSGASGASGIRRRTLRSNVCPIDDEVETIVLKALAKEPERRYQSAEELSRDIARYLRGESVDARRDSLLYRVRVGIRRRKRAFLWGGLAAALVIGALLTAWRAASITNATTQANVLANIAESAFTEGNFTEERILAIKSQIEKALAESPDCAQAHRVAGRLFAQQARMAESTAREELIEKALNAFEKAHRARGGNPFSAIDSASARSDGDPVALWSAIDLMALTNQMERARPLLDLFRQPAMVKKALGYPLVSVHTYFPDARFDSMLTPVSRIDDAPSSSDSPKTNARVRRLLRSAIEPRKLTPFTVGAPHQYIMSLVYEPLFIFDENMNWGRNPGLVESVQRVAGDAGLPEYKVILHQGLLWHDNKPVTADDVVFSWEFYGRPEQRERVSLAAADSRTLIFRHHADRNTALLDMAIEVLPKHLLSPYTPPPPPGDVREDDPNSRVSRFAAALAASGGKHFGCGAFRLTEVANGHVLLKRFDGYKSTPPFIAEMLFEHEPIATRNSALAKSNLPTEAELSLDEFRWSVNGRDFDGRYVKVRSELRAYDYIQWTSRPESPVRDLDVRTAIAYALDLDAIRRQSFDELYSPFGGLWREEAHDREPFEPLRAKDGLAQVERLLGKKWPRAGGPRRSANGDTLKLKLIYQAESPHLARVMACIQASLVEAGFDVDLSACPQSQYADARKSADGFFGAVIANPDSSLDSIRWRKGGERNTSLLQDESIAAEFEQVTLRSSDDRKPRLRDLERKIYDAQPYLFLWERPALWLISKDLRGVTFSDMGPYLHYPGPRGWWVAQ